jgi:hypothetical protein
MIGFRFCGDDELLQDFVVEMAKLQAHKPTAGL